MMWGPGPWGWHMWGMGWIFPLLGLLFIVFMMVFCARMMRGMMGGTGMCGHGQHPTSEADELRREVRELRDEVQKLRAGG
jgi:uncharacterized membrane protein